MANYQLTEEGLQAILDINEGLDKLGDHFQDFSINDLPECTVKEFYNLVTDELQLNIYDTNSMRSILTEQQDDLLIAEDTLDKHTLRKYLAKGYIEKVYSRLDEFVDYLTGESRGPNQMSTIKSKIYELILSEKHKDLEDWFGESNIHLTDDLFGDTLYLSKSDITYIGSHLIMGRPNPDIINEIALKVYNYAVSNNIIEEDGGRRRE